MKSNRKRYLSSALTLLLSLLLVGATAAQDTGNAGFAPPVPGSSDSAAPAAGIDLL